MGTRRDDKKSLSGVTGVVATFDPLHRWTGTGGHFDYQLLIRIQEAPTLSVVCLPRADGPCVPVRSMSPLPGCVKVYLNTYASAK